MAHKGGPLANFLPGEPQVAEEPASKVTHSYKSKSEPSLLKEITPLSPPSKRTEGRDDKGGNYEHAIFETLPPPPRLYACTLVRHQP